MDNVWSILVSAMLSGVFATIITLWWQNKSQLKKEKVRIFTVLMSKRYDVTAAECVESLNMIDVVFYQSKSVRAAWKEFNEATKLPETNTKDQKIKDKHLKLLEVMADDIGYKRIDWETIKQYYYPVGLSNKIRDEAMLRKVQIDVGLAQIAQGQTHTDASQIDARKDLSNKILLKALENPDSIIKLLEIAEKAQNLNEKK